MFWGLEYPASFKPYEGNTVAQRYFPGKKLDLDLPKICASFRQC
jgi:hypothetical protein